MENQTDSFALFLEMMNNDGGNTNDTVKRVEQEYKAEKANEPVYEFEDDSNDEPQYDDEYDFSEMLDSDNLIFEDEDPEAFERSSKGGKAKTEDDNFSGEDEEEATEQEGEAEQPEGGAEYDGSDDTPFDIDVNDFISLPDGREITIGELQDRYLDDERFNQRISEIEQREQAFEQQRAALSDTLTLAQLEADLELQDLAGVDWDYLASTNPQEYAAHKQWQERLLARKNAIAQEQARQEAIKEQAEKAQFTQKAQACVATLKNKIPYWSNEHYSNLLNFAIDELGYDEDSAANEINPSTVYAWHTLYTTKQGTEKVKGRLRRVGSSKHVSSGVNNTPSRKTDIDKAAAAKAFASGKMSHEQAFAMLED